MKHIKLYESFETNQLPEGTEKVALSTYTKFTNTGSLTNNNIEFSAPEKERLESLGRIIGKTVSSNQHDRGKIILTKPDARVNGNGSEIFNADAIVLRKNAAPENEFHYGIATADPQNRYLAATLDGLIALVLDLFGPKIEWAKIK